MCNSSFLAGISFPNLITHPGLPGLGLAAQSSHCTSPDLVNLNVSCVSSGGDVEWTPYPTVVAGEGGDLISGGGGGGNLSSSLLWPPVLLVVSINEAWLPVPDWMLSEPDSAPDLYFSPCHRKYKIMVLWVV